MKQKKRTFGLILVFVFILLVCSVYATLDPDFPKTFHTKSTNPSIFLNFTTNVKLELNELKRGSSQTVGLNGAGESFVKFFTITPAFPLSPTPNIQDSYAYTFLASSTSGTRMDNPDTYKIVIDNLAPTVSIKPNNAIFKKINDPNLTLKISISERAKINKFKINDDEFSNEFDAKYKMEFSKTPDSFKADAKAAYTDDGEKKIYVLAQDLAENTGEGTATFELNADPMLDIFLINPKYGKSPVDTFNVVLGTDNKATCRATTQGENIDYAGLEGNDLETTNNRKHTTKEAVKLDSSEENKYFIWVVCKDPEYSDVETRKKIFIGYDNIAPDYVSAYFEPNELIEPPAENQNLMTKLYVSTTEETLCRFDETYDTFEKMRSRFDGKEKIADFSKIHVAQFNVSAAKKTYSYNIQCIDKAQNPTPKRTETFIVDLSKPLNIEQLTPKYVNTSSVSLRIKTNKQSACRFSKTRAFGINDSEAFIAESGYIFSKPIMAEQGKNYTYYAKCKANRTSEDLVKELFFVVDTTPPDMQYVDDTSPLPDDPEFYYSNSSLRVNYSAKDYESGIKKYTHQIVRKDTSGSINVTGYISNFDLDTKVGRFFFMTGLSLENLKTYVFEVTATNKADLTSQVMQSNGITIDQTKIPDYCYNKVFDSGKESAIDCGITCPRCAPGLTCLNNDDCESDFCKKGICTKATCDDKVRNQGEGDVDCGGPCAACADGRKCNKDEDCKDISYCLDGICSYQPDTCKNRKLDGDETDLDNGRGCGGSCSNPCSPGKACLSNKDCASNDCRNHICIQATCSDNRKNQNEVDIDCGGECEACAAGKKCINDDDCSSKNCDTALFTCNELTRDEQEAKATLQRKLIFFGLLFLIIIVGGGIGLYYAHKKGYLKKWIDYIKNFDWKTFKPKQKPNTFPQSRPGMPGAGMMGKPGMQLPGQMRMPPNMQQRPGAGSIGVGQKSAGTIGMPAAKQTMTLQKTTGKIQEEGFVKLHKRGETSKEKESKDEKEDKDKDSKDKKTTSAEKKDDGKKDEKENNDKNSKSKKEKDEDDEFSNLSKLSDEVKKKKDKK